MSWDQLPKALKWILVIILIPLIINLFTMWRGQSIIDWVDALLGRNKSGPNITNKNAPNTNEASTATTPTAPPHRPSAAVEFMEYRAVLEEARGGLDTLSTDNEIRSGEAIHFLFKLARPGSVYLFHYRDDGFLASVNRDAQHRRAGEWLQVPENKEQVIGFDDKTGAEKFLLIFVPTDSDWTVEKALSPQGMLDSEGMPVIPKEAASRLVASVKGAGVEMSSTAQRYERTVTHKLLAADAEGKPAFHEFQLRHVR